MALKFLNKKGWHTGSLRNIENVWKAEQKRDAEDKKLDELRKQIREEQDRAEFRLLQEQAGLLPKQERLDFLYESGLSVGKGFNEGSGSGSGSGFKDLHALPPSTNQTAAAAASSSTTKVSNAPGALFEDKPQSANDAWRKLHSDPLLLIKQKEQEALARVKNNPIRMEMIRKAVEAKKQAKKVSDEEKHKKKHHSKNTEKRKRDGSTRRDEGSNLSDGNYGKDILSDKNSQKGYPSDSIQKDLQRGRGRDEEYRQERNYRDDRRHSDSAKNGREERKHPSSPSKPSGTVATHRESRNKHYSKPNKLTEEERAAKLREMQMDAELHEEQRWKRIKKAEVDDAKEAIRASNYRGKNFLDEANKSVYGAEEGGSFTIEESVRRRTHYSQRTSGEENAFRR